jgi:hypothetical protein
VIKTAGDRGLAEKAKALAATAGRLNTQVQEVAHALHN